MDVVTVKRERPVVQARLNSIDLDDPAVVREEIGRIDWWHSIDLGNGIVTPGRSGPIERITQIQLSADLTGKTVLDIGAWDGAFSFEAERRGAKRVVALDLCPSPGFELARRVLKSRVEFREADITTADPQEIGSYDVVLFMGVIYHVPNPFDLLERVGRMTRDLMILETDTTRNWTLKPVAEFRGSRAAYFNPSENWWIPNVRCVEEMLKAAGFERFEQVFGPPPPPRTRAGQVLKRVPGLFGRTLPGWNSRLVMHAWK